MKSKIKWILCCALVLPIALFVAGCFGGKNPNKKHPPSNGSKLELSSAHIRLAPQTDLYYDGSEKLIVFTVSKPDKTDFEPFCESNQYFDVEYQNNTNVGKATAKITATANNPHYQGSFVSNFDILPAAKVVSSKQELFDAVNNSNYSPIVLKTNNQTISINSNETLLISNTTLQIVETTLQNNGTINIEGNGLLKVGPNSGVIDAFLENNGTISNNGNIVVTAHGIVINAGHIINPNTTNNGQKSINMTTYGSMYSNSDVSNISGGIYYRRQPISNYNIVLSGVEYDSNTAFVYFNELAQTPSVAINGKQATLSTFEVSYENNTNVGKAIITISATRKSQYFFGSTVVEFEIRAKEVVATTMSNLTRFLTNPNYSKIKIDGLLLTNSFTIPKTHTLTILGNTNIDVLIENTGCIVVDGNGKVVVASQIQNNGSIVNNGLMFVENSGYLVGNQIDNSNGAIYSNGSLVVLGNAAIVRNQLSQNNIELLADGFEYNTKAQYPSLLDENNNALSSDEFLISYQYAGETTFSTPKKAGTINVVISAKSTSKRYFGTITLSYSIARGEIEVDNASDLKTALADPSYKKVIVNNSTSKIKVDSLTLAENTHLVVGQSSTTTLVIWGQFENNGSITINGNLAMQNSATISGNGSIVNNGKLYINDLAIDGVLGNGQVFVRKNISAYTLALKTGDRFYYVNKNTYPEMTISNGEETIDVSSDLRFLQFGVGNTTVVFEPNVLSELFYGKIETTISVYQGEISVLTYSELVAALADKIIRDGERYSNYRTIILAADITLEDSIVVEPDQILDMRQYVAKLPQNGLAATSTITNYGSIWLSKKQVAAFFIKNAQKDEYSSCGKIVGYALDANMFAYFLGSQMIVNELYLESDISVSSIWLNIDIDISSTIKIDLQGHTISGQITFQNCYSAVTITSTGSMGTIGTTANSSTSDPGYGIVIRNNGSGSNKTIYLKNIRVCGSNGIKNYDTNQNKPYTTDSTTIIAANQ